MATTREVEILHQVSLPPIIWHKVASMFGECMKEGLNYQDCVEMWASSCDIRRSITHMIENKASEVEAIQKWLNNATVMIGDGPMIYSMPKLTASNEKASIFIFGKLTGDGERAMFCDEHLYLKLCPAPARPLQDVRDSVEVSQSHNSHSVQGAAGSNDSSLENYVQIDVEKFILKAKCFEKWLALARGKRRSCHNDN